MVGALLSFPHLQIPNMPERRAGFLLSIAPPPLTQSAESNCAKKGFSLVSSCRDSEDDGPQVESRRFRRAMQRFFGSAASIAPGTSVVRSTGNSIQDLGVGVDPGSPKWFARSGSSFVMRSVGSRRFRGPRKGREAQADARHRGNREREAGNIREGRKKKKAKENTSIAYL